MASLKIWVCLVFTATLANSLQSGLHNDMNNLSQEDKQAIALWWKDQVLGNGDRVILTKFAFNDCGGTKSLVHISEVSVQPDPVKIPGTLSVGASFVDTAILKSPIKQMMNYSEVNIRICQSEKNWCPSRQDWGQHHFQGWTKIGTVEWKYRIGILWIKLPCVEQIGSCSYDDVCALLSGKGCPQKWVDVGFNCTCPVEPKTYALPPQDFSIDAAIFPYGEHKIQANLTYNGIIDVCANIDLTFKKS